MDDTLIFDVESDGFLDAMARLWTIQIGTADGNDVTVYADQPGFPSLAAGAERLSKATRLVSHNGLRFDLHAVNRFFPGAIRREALFDTLVASRLLQPEERRHSLEAWGQRLGILKGAYSGDFQAFDEELLTYAKQDVVVGRALYHKTKVVETWGESFALEMAVAQAIAAQEDHGFGFDVEAAQTLDAELRGELSAMKDGLRDIFPPRFVSLGEFVPKRDNRASGYVGGCPLTKITFQAFNPASRQQVASRLQGLGWKPKEFGANGSATVDEKILASLPYPEAKRLVAFFGLNKKLGMLSDGDSAWLKFVKNGRIHGAVNPNGAVTGRMSHYAPNTAQVDSDPRMRALWRAVPPWVMVGVDAEGLEARTLAHYLARYDGGAFTHRLINGRKEDGSDIHSANAKAVASAGYRVGRNGAKTLLYALVYGAGLFKLGETVKQALRDQNIPPPGRSSKAIGEDVRGALAQSMKGIDRLSDDVKAVAKKRGHLVGLDGRHLHIRSEHSALNTLLQSAGAIVMKKALATFYAKHEHNHGREWGLCASVHDECQMDAVPELAPVLGEDFKAAITAAGEHFNLRCPLSGEAKIGPSWRFTH